MQPTIKELERLIRLKDAAVQSQQDGLIALSKRLDGELYDYITAKVLPRLDFGNGGRVKLTNRNIDASRNIKQLQAFIDGKVDKRLKTYYLSASKDVYNGSANYFEVFNPSKEIRKSINKRADNAFKNLTVSIFTQSNVQSRVENALNGAVLGTLKEQELTQTLEDVILGKQDKGGINQTFHYQNGYDAIQQQSRLVDVGFASKLSLNYAIYTGGVIKTSRDFCESRSGKVYNREEIEAFQDLGWTGKKNPHVILLDCGGYNCRHYYAWISYQLAKRLRKDIPKSEYDK